MIFEDATFSDHAKRLVFTQNSYTWPKYWRALVFKISMHTYTSNDREYFVVRPRNPDYQKYVDEESRHYGGPGPLYRSSEAPPMSLDPIEFDTVDEIDRWAKVAWRIR